MVGMGSWGAAVAAAFVVGGDGLTSGTGMDEVSFVGGERPLPCVVAKRCVSGARRHGGSNLCPKKQIFGFFFSAVLMARIEG